MAIDSDNDSQLSPMAKSRLDKLKEQRAQLDEKIKVASRRESQQRRKADTRRKIIAGALALEHMEKNPGSAFAKKLASLLDEYVTKPNERKLMGLSESPSSNDNLSGEFAQNTPSPEKG